MEINRVRLGCLVATNNLDMDSPQAMAARPIPTASLNFTASKAGTQLTTTQLGYTIITGDPFFGLALQQGPLAGGTFYEGLLLPTAGVVQANQELIATNAQLADFSQLRPKIQISGTGTPDRSMQFYRKSKSSQKIQTLNEIVLGNYTNPSNFQANVILIDPSELDLAVGSFGAIVIVHNATSNAGTAGTNICQVSIQGIPSLDSGVEVYNWMAYNL